MAVIALPFTSLNEASRGCHMNGALGCLQVQYQLLITLSPYYSIVSFIPSTTKDSVDPIGAYLPQYQALQFIGDCDDRSVTHVFELVPGRSTEGSVRDHIVPLLTHPALTQGCLYLGSSFVEVTSLGLLWVCGFAATEISFATNQNSSNIANMSLNSFQESPSISAFSVEIASEHKSAAKGGNLATSLTTAVDNRTTDAVKELVRCLPECLFTVSYGRHICSIYKPQNHIYHK